MTIIQNYYSEKYYKNLYTALQNTFKHKTFHLQSNWNVYLTLCRQNYFFYFSTSCIYNVNNTGTKEVSIMKQTAF